MDQSKNPVPNAHPCCCGGEKTILIQGEITHQNTPFGTEVKDAVHPEWFSTDISGRAFSAAIPGLEPGRYTVEITLAEVHHRQPGARVMDITSGETTLAEALDPIVAAGGYAKELIIRGEIVHMGDALRGAVTIHFTARKGDAKVHGITIRDSEGRCLACLNAPKHHEAYFSEYAVEPEIAAAPIYRDPSEPLDRRIDDLIRRMSVQEKIAQMINGAAGIERLGVNPHNYWNECLHGVGRAGIATVFPQAIGMAATWNSELIESVGETTSTEARAKHHDALRNGKFAQYYGLTFWSPNINIFRDPRWGRGQETYGEDPCLTSRIAVAFIKGLQGDDPRYLKVVACAKHFAVHSGPESVRQHFDSKVADRDLFDTYLPQFESAIVEGGVWSVMSAYNRLNGTPCSMNRWLLTELLRDKWGFKGHVVSDCGAIDWIWNHHKTVETPEEACALSVKAGCDLECGTEYCALFKALKQGIVTVPDLDLALHRIFEARFRLGMFDPSEAVPYAQIPLAKVDSPEHGALALQTARESMVLLKNDGVLPLDRTKLNRLAVIGANADSLPVLVGNYAGTPSHPVTILEGIRRAAPGVEVTFAQGCPLAIKAGEAIDRDAPAFKEALEIASRADAIIYVGGITAQLEGESGDAAKDIEGFLDGDRTAIELPPIQSAMLRALHALGKPLVFVNCSGSAIAFEWEAENLPAILQAWYPGQAGGTAVAETIFGDYNPGGRLPVTFYRSTADLPPFEEYSMANRTYRYFTGEPLFAFGHGLSYTAFAYGPLNLAADSIDCSDTIRLSLPVKNTGSGEGDEVVQIYMRKVGCADCQGSQPIRKLVGFRRVRVGAGESVVVEFVIATKELRQWDSKRAAYAVAPGQYEIECGASSSDIRVRQDFNLTSAV